MTPKAKAKAKQAERKGVPVSELCGGTRMLGSDGGPAVKIGEEHLHAHLPQLLSAPKIVRRISAEERARRRSPLSFLGPDEITEKELRRLRRRGRWDGGVEVRLPGGSFVVGTQDPGRTRSGRQRRMKPGSFSLADMDIRFPRRDADGNHIDVPTPLQRRSAERALLIETLGNINPYARENRRYSDQVVAAAVGRAIEDHGEPVPEFLASEAGRRLAGEMLRKLLADGVEPERAMFLCLQMTLGSEEARIHHERTRDDADPRFAATRAAMPNGRRRSVTTRPEAVAHLGRLEDMRLQVAADRAAPADLKTVLEGSAVVSTLMEYQRLGSRAMEEGALDEVIPPGPRLLWDTPAYGAVSATAAERRSAGTAASAEEMDARILGEIAAGEISHPGFTLAVALGGGDAARHAQRLLTGTEDLRLVADNAHTSEERAQATSRLENAAYDPGTEAMENLRNLAQVISERPTLLAQERIQQTLLEVATTCVVMADSAERAADVTLEKSRRDAESEYGRMLDHGITWQYCALKAVDEIAHPPSGPHDAKRMRRTLAGILMQGIASDGQEE